MSMPERPSDDETHQQRRACTATNERGGKPTRRLEGFEQRLHVGVASGAIHREAADDRSVKADWNAAGFDGLRGSQRVRFFELLQRLSGEWVVTVERFVGGRAEGV